VTNQFIFPVKLETDEDGRFVATFPDLPYGATDGATKEEALLSAEDALQEVIAGLINSGEDIPEPSTKKRGQHLVPLSAQMSAKAALYTARRAAGISNVALAKKIGCDEKEVRRMLDPHHPTKLPRIEAAIQALGQRLMLTVVPRTQEVRHH
jgi:antitoxin HicB